jgi:hypothetical protein
VAAGCNAKEFDSVARTIRPYLLGVGVRHTFSSMSHGRPPVLNCWAATEPILRGFSDVTSGRSPETQQRTTYAPSRSDNPLYPCPTGHFRGDTHAPVLQATRCRMSYVAVASRVWRRKQYNPCEPSRRITRVRADDNEGYLCTERTSAAHVHGEELRISNGKCLSGSLSTCGYKGI